MLRNLLYIVIYTLKKYMTCTKFYIKYNSNEVYNSIITRYQYPFICQALSNKNSFLNKNSVKIILL